MYFLGKLHHDEVLKRIHDSDLFVLTSIEERLPIVLIEAMSLGTPVITTEVGEIPEIIQTGFNGILIPPKSPNFVAESIERILQDKIIAKKLSENARKSIYHLKWSSISSQYETLLLKKI